MNNNYILRLKDSLLSFYYSEDKTISVRKYENGKFHTPEVLLNDALPGFTISVKNNEPNIFCRDKSGSIFLISRLNETYSKQVILENKSEQIHKILFHSLGRDGNMSLIYNIPDTGKRYKLIKQSLSESGVWDKPNEIDVFQSFKDTLFSIQSIGRNHHIVIYMDPSGSLGYREITPEKYGEFNTIAPLADNVLDYSILTTNDTIHFLYITGNFFNLRLMYKKKTDDSFTKPLVLWEGQRIENCLLWINKDNLTASFMSAKSLYIQKSVNNGDSFYQPEIYRNKFCLNPVRASYISEIPMDKSDFFAREVYIDMYNPWDVQILPDISKSYFPDVIIPEPKPVDEAPKEAPPAEKLPPDIVMERLNKVSAENQDLRYRLAKASEELNEKNSSLEILKRSSLSEKERYENEVRELKNSLSILEASYKALSLQKTYEQKPEPSAPSAEMPIETIEYIEAAAVQEEGHIELSPEVSEDTESENN